MMKFTTVKELFEDYEQFLGREITLGGWIRTSRDSKAFGFIELNDGSYLKNVQIVATEEKLPNFREVMKYNVGAAIIVRGLLVKSPGGSQLLRCRRRRYPWRARPRRTIRFRKTPLRRVPARDRASAPRARTF